MTPLHPRFRQRAASAFANSAECRAVVSNSKELILWTLPISRRWPSALLVCRVIALNCAQALDRPPPPWRQRLSNNTITARVSRPRIADAVRSSSPLRLSRGSILLVVSSYGHRKLKDGAVRRVRGHCQLPAMRFDNRAANRQAHSHALGLRRVERLKDAI